MTIEYESNGNNSLNFKPTFIGQTNPSAINFLKSDIVPHHYLIDVSKSAEKFYWLGYTCVIAH